MRGARLVKVFGNTYEHRDKIKALGDAYFSQEGKCWVIRVDHLPQGHRAELAQKTYALGKLGLRFEVER